ncbi:Cytochrome c556 [Cohaesibacter sp. ES.047]|uniref:c-type cytochrome n=1 Tax=Cohaesibacter sp. ES.047 TaxID=1798205 RepID=UPI000BB8C511|nr:cytochrome c [Cohaesibacter sp. ES.047]SNY90548.1 Cytochrome c556 [Cohaesibacter sp. ES.047]
MKKITFIAVACALLATPALANEKEDAVKARQAFYKSMGGEMRPLMNNIKGEYDAASAQEHADKLASITKTDVTTYFVEGTSNQDMPGKTEASPKIWEDMAGFKEKFSALQTAVATLKVEAGKGKAELGAAFQQVGASCKSCHDAFREK